MTRRLRPSQPRHCGFILQARIKLEALDELFSAQPQPRSLQPGDLYPYAVDRQRGVITISTFEAPAPDVRSVSSEANRLTQSQPTGVVGGRR